MKISTHEAYWSWHGDLLYIKVADFALSGKADLGKPIDYHSNYASQKIAERYDQYPMDIWSAGGLGLQLLEGVLPARSGYTLDRQHDYVVMLETHVMLRSRTSTDDNGLRFLTRVLKSKHQYRPTAKELLQDPWIQDTKNYNVFQSPMSRSVTPQSSRHASVGPSNKGPSSIISRQSSKDRTARPIPNPTSQDGYNDSESEVGTPTSSNSRFTTNLPASEPSLGSRTPMPYDWKDKTGMPGQAVGSPHSKFRNGEGVFPVVDDENRSTTPRSRRSNGLPPPISHASTGHNTNDEETGSVKSYRPVKKRARRAPAVPLSGASSRP